MYTLNSWILDTIRYHIVYVVIFLIHYLEFVTKLPIGSMYSIYGNIYHQYTPDASIYTIHIGGLSSQLWPELYQL